jgi:hypothetical protein
MSERHEDPATRAGRPITTGEFRATPDVSASTAQFRAFAEKSAEPGRSWDAVATSRSVPKMAIMIVVVVVILAAIVLLVVH